MLSKTWKELPPTDRAGTLSVGRAAIAAGEQENGRVCPMLAKSFSSFRFLFTVYMAEERKLREKYKIDMGEWRQKVAKEKKIEREEREVAALQAAEAGPPPGMDAEGMENKWMGPGMRGGQPDDLQQQQFQQAQQEQQQRHDMAQASMLSNPYLQAAAFGGGQMDARAAALGFNQAGGGNPYLAANMNMNAFAGQGYMQGGNPALSLFGKHMVSLRCWELSLGSHTPYTH